MIINKSQFAVCVILLNEAWGAPSRVPTSSLPSSFNKRAIANHGRYLRHTFICLRYINNLEENPDTCTCTRDDQATGTVYKIVCNDCEECATFEPSDETSPPTSANIFENQEASSRLIEDGGFEEGFSPGSTEWKADTWSWQRNPLFAWGADIGVEGSGGGMIQNDQANDSRFYQTVSGLVPGRQYRVTGKLKLDSYAWVADQPWECGASLSRIPSLSDHSECINEVTNGEWKSVQMVFTAESESEQIGCRLGYFSSIVSGTLYCDDIQIEPIVRARRAQSSGATRVCRRATRYYDQKYWGSLIRQSSCVEYTDGPHKGSTLCLNEDYRSSTCSVRFDEDENICQSCSIDSANEPVIDCSNNHDGGSQDFMPNPNSRFIAFVNEGTFTWDSKQECLESESNESENANSSDLEDDPKTTGEKIGETIAWIAIAVCLALCLCGGGGYYVVKSDMCGNLYLEKVW